MEILVLGVSIGFILSTLCYVVYIIATSPYKADGEIVMHEDELYLAISEKDKDAFQKKHYATLKLVREKFRGFNEP